MLDSVILLHQDTLDKLKQYQASLATHGLAEAGAYFKAALQAVEKPISELDISDFLFLLLNTKKPQIFAESQVRHTQEDWTPLEASLLGDITIHMEVNLFNNGGHARAYTNHSAPIAGSLAYVPGALLLPSAPDHAEIIVEGKLNQEKLNALYMRRLLPQLIYINKVAEQVGKKAAITIPGIGTGCFAGTYGNDIKPAFQAALRDVLVKNVGKLSQIDRVHYDAFIGDVVFDEQIEHIKFEVCASQRHPTTAQLVYPEGTEAQTHTLTSFVAWDHFSFPGNDYWVGSRTTDDGVKGASTDTMYKVTGTEGTYHAEKGAYDPPSGYSNWRQVANQKETRLHAPIFVLNEAGILEPLQPISENLLSKAKKPSNHDVSEKILSKAEKSSSSDERSHDNSFYLNCLGTLLLGGGVGMLIAAVILMNPYLLGAGLVVTGLGLNALGLFGSVWTDQKEDKNHRPSL